MGEYNSSSIQILEGLEAVRKRPGMYIGSTSSRGLHHLIWEIIDNSIDEVLAGFCTDIKISINKDGSITVEDNGRGIPVDIHPKTGISTLETVFTVLHAGGKFNSDTYKISGGLHGVGASVVNALSSWLKVRVMRDGKIYEADFINGGQIERHVTEVGTSDHTGTIVSFYPDPTIFVESIVFNSSIIQNRIKQLAFLNKGLKISLVDLRDEEDTELKSFQFNNGIKDYINELQLKSGNAIADIFYVENEQENIVVECGFQYSESYSENIISFCNNINTGEGGYHEDGFRLGLLRCFNNYVNNQLSLKNFEKFTWDDIKEGLTAIISIKHPNPQYEGQTKTKLGNAEVKGIVNNIVGENLAKFLMENPSDAKKIIDKILLSLKARVAAQNARESTRRKSILDDNNFNLPGKLSDCTTKDATKAELFIVEGDSAGGSAKSGRDRFFQAILPLRGKVLNVEKARLNKAFENNEIISIITAFGTDIKERMDVSKLRYHKIIIMTDADVDGSHIRILLLTLFYRYMRPLIEQGHIYIAQSPLYKIDYSKKVKYCYSDNELSDFKKYLAENKFEKYSIQRYKGLGEMNPEQLWETTMDPTSRVLLQVTINDAMEANTICTELMGEDVAPRKKFIKENAKYVRNLDV